MCEGIPVFSNNKTAKHGTGTSSHSTAAIKLRIKEDRWMKSEYHWWDKTFVPDRYDFEGIKILESNGVDIDKATRIAEKYVKTHFRTQAQLVSWLKKTPTEWNRLIGEDMVRLAKLVNPKLVLYRKKIEEFKKQPIDKFNPYQATELPSLKELRSSMPAQVGAQVWDQVRDQVWDQVGDQVGAQVWDQVGDQVRDQVGAQVGDQVWAQVGAQVWDQVRDQVGAQVGDQVGAQVGATSYWAVKITLGLPIKHWFFDFLKLGVMVIFVQGKVKVFGKKGKYLGEYNQEDFT